MPYLVGDLIAEITAGGPVPSFPKSFNGPPKMEKEQEALALDESKLKTAEESQTEVQEPQEDWVKKKWAWYYEPNKIGEVKPNFSKMNVLQFEQYMKDAQAQGRHRLAAVSRHMGTRVKAASSPDLQQERLVGETKVAPAAPRGSRKRKAVAPVAGHQPVNANTESGSRKKPRVKSHVTKEQYLEKH